MVLDYGADWWEANDRLDHGDGDPVELVDAEKPMLAVHVGGLQSL